MGKTDKELTVEVVTAYLAAWSSKENTVAINGAGLECLIQDTYNVISNLDKSPSQD